MKKTLLLLVIVLAWTGLAGAQVPDPTENPVPEILDARRLSFRDLHEIQAGLFVIDAVRTLLLVIIYEARQPQIVQILGDPADFPPIRLTWTRVSHGSSVQQLSEVVHQRRDVLFMAPR